MGQRAALLPLGALLFVAAACGGDGPSPSPPPLASPTSAGPSPTSATTTPTPALGTAPPQTASLAPSPTPGLDDCAVASAAQGRQVCVLTVPDEVTWASVSLPSSAPDQAAITKYLTPAVAEARLPPLVMDVHAYTLHYDFMVGAFPERFPGLSPQEYNALILDAQAREFFAGTLALYFLPEGGTAYGFTVWDDPADPAATVTLEDVTSVWESLQPGFGLGTLAFYPSTTHQIAAAKGWAGAPFPILGEGAPLSYEVYTQAVGYGTARLYTLAALAEATVDAAFGYQDVLILEEAPSDVERVIAGAVTGTRQGELSHLNVRSAARGTPNCYIPEPLETLSAWEGRLVRLSCGPDALGIQEATQAEAEAWWAELRPEPIPIPTPDLAWEGMEGLLEVDTLTEAARRANLTRYGAKGANLATLYRLVDRPYQLDGFLIPFIYYDQFMATQGWIVDLGQGLQFHTFAETLAAWLEDDPFLTDGALRRARLESLRDAIEDAPVDPALVDALETRLLAIFGDAETMVRFRSSSNAEDSLLFSGAGLYDSTSACLADELDDDTQGPSRCDPSQDKERTVRRALRKVWASLWNTEAYEERAWYGIDHRQAAMGILVDTRVAEEQANIVAFTGNPTGPGDDRYLINAQAGELDVVSAEPGVVPETVALTLSEEGEVIQIDRIKASSEVPPGETVLSDAQLREIGGILFNLSVSFPVDEPPPPNTRVLLDTEWKVRSDGQLIIKQIRPFTQAKEEIP